MFVWRRTHEFPTDDKRVAWRAKFVKFCWRFGNVTGIAERKSRSTVCSLAGINLNLNAEIFMILLWFTESFRRCEGKLYDERELWRLFSSRVDSGKICFKSDINLDSRIYIFSSSTFWWWTRTAAIKRNFSLFSSTLMAVGRPSLCSFSVLSQRVVGTHRREEWKLMAWALILMENK